MRHVRFTQLYNLLHLQQIVHDFEVAERLRIPFARPQHCLEGTFTKHINFFTVKRVGGHFKQHLQMSLVIRNELILVRDQL